MAVPRRMPTRPPATARVPSAREVRARRVWALPMASVLAATLLSTTSARAQDLDAGAAPSDEVLSLDAPEAPPRTPRTSPRPRPPRGPSPAEGRVDVDLGLYVRGGEPGDPSKGWWLSPRLRMALPVDRVWTFDLALTMSAGRQHETTGEISFGGSSVYSLGAPASVGNPTLGATRWLFVGPGRLGVGGFAALPLSLLFQHNEVQLFGAAALRGLWDYWQWAPRAGALAVAGEYRFALDALDLGGSWTLGGMVRLDGASDVVFFAQLGATALYRLRGRSGVGLDLRAVWFPAIDGLFQVSMVPRGRLALGRADLDLWFTLNLNEPLGFSFDADRYWGLGTTFTWHLD